MTKTRTGRHTSPKPDLPTPPRPRRNTRSSGASDSPTALTSGPVPQPDLPTPPRPRRNTRSSGAPDSPTALTGGPVPSGSRLPRSSRAKPTSTITASSSSKAKPKAVTAADLKPKAAATSPASKRKAKAVTISPDVPAVSDDVPAPNKAAPTGDGEENAPAPDNQEDVPAPDHAAPAPDGAAADDAPADDAPADDALVDNAPADDAPADDVPADDAPVDDAPADDAPADHEDTPTADDAPADNVSADDAPIDDEAAPTEEDAPGDDAPTENEDADADADDEDPPPSSDNEDPPPPSDEESSKPATDDEDKVLVRYASTDDDDNPAENSASPSPTPSPPVPPPPPPPRRKKVDARVLTPTPPPPDTTPPVPPKKVTPARPVTPPVPPKKTVARARPVTPPVPRKKVAPAPPLTPPPPTKKSAPTPPPEIEILDQGKDSSSSSDSSDNEEDKGKGSWGRAEHGGLKGELLRKARVLLKEKVKEWDSHAWRAAEIAEELHLKLDEVKQASAISWKRSQELNEGRRRGASPANEIQKMVAAEPAGTWSKEVGRLRIEYLAHQEQQDIGTRRQMQPQRDVANVANVLMKSCFYGEPDRLSRIRILTGSNIHDTIATTIVGSEDSLRFFQEMHKVDPITFAMKYRSWATAEPVKARAGEMPTNPTQRRAEVVNMIERDLHRKTGNDRLKMNYNNYERVMLGEVGWELVGWPENAPLRRPPRWAVVEPPPSSPWTVGGRQFPKSGGTRSGQYEGSRQAFEGQREVEGEGEEAGGQRGGGSREDRSEGNSDEEDSDDEEDVPLLKKRKATHEIADDEAPKAKKPKHADLPPKKVSKPKTKSADPPPKKTTKVGPPVGKKRTSRRERQAPAERTRSESARTTMKGRLKRSSSKAPFAHSRSSKKHKSAETVATDIDDDDAEEPVAGPSKSGGDGNGGTGGESQAKKREIEAAAAEVREKNRAYVEMKKKATAKAPKARCSEAQEDLKQMAEDDDQSFGGSESDENDVKSVHGTGGNNVSYFCVDGTSGIAVGIIFNIRAEWRHGTGGSLLQVRGRKVMWH
ncbi:hypothetical protein B0H12DRAFT_1080433 [Mycena haematopus]|nr:hypothetical protein B0H12DRAFT_1080433 [Mycena haematopus]